MCCNGNNLGSSISVTRPVTVTLHIEIMLDIPNFSMIMLYMSSLIFNATLVPLSKDGDYRLALRIWRNSSNTDSPFLPLIDMSYGSVILSDDYSELSLMLPTDNVYGQGAGALSFDKNGANSNKTLLYNRCSHLLFQLKEKLKAGSSWV